MIDKIVFIASFLLMLSAYMFYSFFEERFNIKIFYPFTSLAYVGFIYAYKVKLKRGGFKVLVNIVLATAISNFIDEVFFDNTTHFIYEYINFVVIIVIAVGNERKRRIKRN